MVVNYSRRKIFSRRPFRRGNMTSGMKRMSQQSKLKTVVRTPKGSIKQQVKSLARQVRHIEPEIKFADFSLTTANWTNAGFIVELSAIAAGTDQSQRIADSIRIKSINLIGVAGNTTTEGNNIYDRFCIVQDKQQIADTDVVITDVFTSTSPNVQMLSLDTLGRFKIIWMSKMFSMDAIQDGSMGGNSMEYTFSGDINVRYNGTAATDVQKNGIFFIAMTNSANATQDFEGSCRVGFIDS